MAEAYKCDRCGKFYDGHDIPIEISDKDGYRMNAKQIRLYGDLNHRVPAAIPGLFNDKILAGPSKTEKLDLCENCMAKLYSWLVNPDATDERDK